MARVPTNVYAKSHERVKLDGFRGIDTSSAAVDVEKYRATEMRNFISRNGLNHKRNGWEQQLLNIKNETLHPNSFGGAVQGIYGFKFAGETQTRIIVYANKCFFQKIGNGVFEKMRCDSQTLEDRPCQFYLIGDYLYIIGCGDFLCFYNGASSIYQVANYAYIPNTIINIAPQEYNNETEYPIYGVANEAVNLLTPKRKATLKVLPLKTYPREHYFEYEETIKKNKTVEVLLSTNGSSLWGNLTIIYDNKEYSIREGINNIAENISVELSLGTLKISNYNDTEKTVTIRQSSADKTEDVGIATYLLEDNSEILGFDADISLAADTIFGADDNTVIGKVLDNKIVFANSPSYSASEIFIKPSSTEINLIVKTLGASVEITSCKNGNSDITNYEVTYLDYDKAQIYITVDEWSAEGLILNYDIIKYSATSKEGTLDVIYEKTVKGHKERITGCKVSQMFGVNGHSDRMFVAGNDESINDWEARQVVQWSEIDNFTYFPDTNYTRLGTQATGINGMQRLNDDSLCIFKEASTTEPTIYVMYGQYDTDTNDNTIDVFRTYAGNVAEGLIAPNSTANLAGDILMLSSNGVYGIEMSENVVSTSKYTKERSLPIKKLLKEFSKEEFKKACSIVRDDRYLLCVGDKCFVAESRYSYKPKGSPRDTFSYEWYVWDNIPALCFADIDGELYFGTADGRLCKFDNKFTDRTIEDFGATTVNESVDSGGTITVDAKLKKGDKLIISNAFEGKIANGTYIGNDILQFTEKEFFVKDEKENLFCKFIVGKELVCYGSNKKRCRIEEIDLANCSIKIFPYGFTFSEEEYSVCYELANQELTIINPDAKPEEEGQQATVAIYDIPISAFYFTEGTTWQGRNYIEKNVVAEWYSAIMDFGTPDYSKTLLGFTVAPERIEGDNVSFGYITKEIDSDHDIQQLRKNLHNVVGNPMDLDALSLYLLSFDTFQTSFTKKVKVRNFNYLMWFIKSDSATDTAINNVVFDYKINRKNKGAN